MKVEGVIFDMDGVVVDTVPIHFRAWERMAKDYGITLTFDAYKTKVDGIPRIDGAKAILEGFDEKTVIEASNKKQGYFLEYLSQEEIPIHQSTVAWIDELKKRGLGVAVISSSKNARFILDKIGVLNRLDTLVAGNDITKGKPDPQIFLKAAEGMGRDPKACVVVEDAVLGVEAAKNAKMFCVGIDRYGDPKRLADADVQIADAKDLSIDKLLSLAEK